jgi:type IV pilus assembly protein PilW
MYTIGLHAKGFIKPATHQRGASLVELMVGITIGLLVVLAAMGSLLYTYASSSTMGDATRLQQKADTAFRIINFQVLQAGAIELVPTVDPSTVVFSTGYTGIDPSTTALANKVISVHGENEAGRNKDILRVSYQDNVGSTTTSSSEGTGTVHDCLGNRPTLSTRVDNEFTFNAASGELRCTGSKAGVGAMSIADGVEDFQVTYGVRTYDAAGAEQYRLYDANAVPDWSKVQSITVCLQLRGDKKGNPRPDLTDAKAIPACGSEIDSNDGYIRRVYRRTFSMRNALS